MPVAGIQLGVGWSRDLAADGEQRAEGVERIKTAIEPECELVEIGLQVARAHTVMAAAQPAFQVGKHQMDDGQIFFDDGRIAILHDGRVLVASGCERGIAAPAIGDDHRARGNSALHEAAEGFGASVGRDLQAYAPGIASAPSWRGLLGFGFTPPNFDGSYDKRFIVVSPALATRCAADPGLVNLDALLRIATDPVPAGADHAGAELVENLEGGLVSGEAELALELDGGHSGCHARHQIGTPELVACFI